LTGGWTPSGIFAIAQTVGASRGNGTLIMSSSKTTSPFTGSSLFLGMNGVSMDTQPITSGSPATFTMTPDSGSGSSVYFAGNSTTIGDGGPTGDTSINGGRSVALSTAGGDIYLYEPGSGTEAVHVGRDSSSGTVRSETIYNRTYTNAANVYVTSFGTVGRSTSLERNKVNIDRTWADDSELLAKVKALTPASFYDRGNAERYAEWASLPEAVRSPNMDAQFPRRILGLIAEDVEATGLTDLLTHDDDGALAGVAYDRLAVALIPWLRDLEARLVALESTVGPVGSSA
jgi:hypothetical protein